MKEDQLTFGEDSLVVPESGPWHRDPNGALHVQSGEVLRLHAGSVLHYTFVHIEAGGKVIIERGRRKFTFIKVRDYFKNEGVLEVRRFRSGGGSFTQQAPDGEALEVFLEEGNRGGDGGDGAKINGCRYGGVNRPGRGARGTSQYGGGGGSGVGWSRSYQGACVPGGDAGDWRGARGGGNHPGGEGGDGSVRGTSVNGGYVYIRSDGYFVSDGLLDFRGEAGAAGEPGDTQNALGPGGGGGGAPGGQGGVLFVKCSDIRGILNFQATGGPGGSGGSGGSAYGMQAQQGDAGEVGYDGELNLI